MSFSRIIAGSFKHKSTLAGKSVAAYTKKTAVRIISSTDKVVDNLKIPDEIPDVIKNLVKKVTKKYPEVKFEIENYTEIPKGLDGTSLLYPFKVIAKNDEGTRVAASELFRWFDDQIKKAGTSGINSCKETLGELVETIARNVTRPLRNNLTPTEVENGYKNGCSQVKTRLQGAWSNYMQSEKEASALSMESYLRYITEHGKSSPFIFPKK